MRKIIVAVTAKDIARGKQCKAEECPIAWSLLRQTKRAWTVRTFRAFSTDGILASMGLPESARNFIARFDKRGPKGVKPIRFTAMVEGLKKEKKS